MLSSDVENRNCYNCNNMMDNNNYANNCEDNQNECNYKCDCGCENEEEVLPIMNLPEVKKCPRDCKREEMIMKIKELDFAIIELALYLDTHPDDNKALCLHNNYSKKVKELKDKYQKVYGPLTMDYPCNKWRWLEQPWPWERGNY